MSQSGAGKKTKANSFSRFMFQYRDKEQAKGRKIDLNTATLEAGKIWQGLSVTEKMQVLNSGCKIPLNKPVVEELKHKPIDKELNKYQQSKLTIDKLLDEPNFECKKFYFISLQYFLKADGFVWPCELAMCEFSLKEGVTRKMHTMINPGILPTGFYGDAAFHSKKSHRIELPTEERDTPGETNKRKIFSSIMDFVGARKFNKLQVQPFFTGIEEKEIEAVEIALEIFAQESGYEYNAFTLLPVDQLMYKLHIKCSEIQKGLNLAQNQPLKSLASARDAIEHDYEFAYSSIGCDYHNEIDFPNFCCLSKVQRWGFSIARNCLDHRFRIIPGGHCPPNYCDRTSDRNFLPVRPILSSVIEDYHSVQAQSTVTDSTDTESTANDEDNCSVQGSSTWVKKFLSGCPLNSKLSSLSLNESTSFFCTDVDAAESTDTDL